jgi:hypothetical protein
MRYLSFLTIGFPLKLLLTVFNVGFKLRLIMQSSLFFSFMILVALLLATPQDAEAYVGPGAGIAAIGTVIALIGGILLAIVAFIWYPIKRLLAMIKKKRMKDKEDLSS